MSGSWTEAAIAGVLARVRERAGLTFEPHRRKIVEDTLEQLRVDKRLESPSAFLAALERSDSLVDEVLWALTVGETYFFREPEQFELLRSKILPERLSSSDRFGGQVGLHLWSAGCASGEEPYSVAILLEQEGLLEQASLFASDLSEPALVRARAGSYREWSFRGLDPAVRARYFEPDGNQHRLKADLRSRVIFFPFNLAAPDSRRLWLGLWGLDVVLCRNVLIYLTEDAQRRAYQRLVGALAPGGWLLLGASDPPPPGDLPLSAFPTRSGHVYRRDPLEAPIEPERPAVAPSALRASSLIGLAPPPEDPGAARVRWDVLEVARAKGPEAALAWADEGVRQAPLDVDLRYGRALLLLELGRPKVAAEALREVLYLDRTLPAAHFLDALVKDKLRDPRGALRSLDNATALLADRLDDEPLRLGQGETVGSLRVAIRRARVRLARLGPGAKAGAR